MYVPLESMSHIYSTSKRVPNTYVGILTLFALFSVGATMLRTSELRIYKPWKLMNTVASASLTCYLSLFAGVDTSNAAVGLRDILKVETYLKTTLSDLDQTSDVVSLRQVDNLLTNFNLNYRIQTLMQETPDEYLACATEKSRLLRQDMYTTVEYFSVSNSERYSMKTHKLLNKTHPYNS